MLHVLFKKKPQVSPALFTPILVFGLVGFFGGDQTNRKINKLKDVFVRAFCIGGLKNSMVIGTVDLEDL